MKRDKSIPLIVRIFFGIGILLSIITASVFIFARDPFPGMIVGIQAVIWLLIGGIGCHCINKKERMRQELLISGRRILADVTSVYLDRRFTINGRHPFRIACQYADEGTKTIYTFESEALWFDPRRLMNSNQVEVCVDYNDYRRYAVDTKQLLNGYTVM